MENFEHETLLFVCDLCAMEFCDLKSYLSHQQFHSIISEDKYLCCGYNSCQKYFSNQSLLRIHLRYFHSIQVEIHNSSSDASQNNICMSCSVKTCQQKFDTKMQLINHVIEHIKNGFEMECPFESCKMIFTNVSSFNNHRYKKHPNFSNNMKDTEPNINLDHCNESITRDNVEDYEEIYKQNLANFYLKLEAYYNIPVSTIERIAIDLENLHQQERDITFAKIRTTFMNEGIPQSTISVVLNIINRSEIFSTYNPKFKTNALRKSHFFPKIFMSNHKKL